MYTVIQDRTTTEDGFKPTHWDDFVWTLGCRTHSLGEYVMKLGDRIHRDAPMGPTEAWKLGNAMGRRKAGEDIDMDQVFAKAATA